MAASVAPNRNSFRSPLPRTQVPDDIRDRSFEQRREHYERRDTFGKLGDGLREALSPVCPEPADRAHDGDREGVEDQLEVLETQGQLWHTVRTDHAVFHGAGRYLLLL